LNRHQSRVLAIQYGYHSILNNKSSLSDGSVDVFWKEQSLSEDKHVVDSYFLTLVRGVKNNLLEIDDLINKNLENWKIERVERVDLSILRVSIFEMLFAETKIPAAIAINEAVEIAKRFSVKDSPSFINGVLDSLVKKQNIDS